jgi:mannonate dehydratase
MKMAIRWTPHSPRDQLDYIRQIPGVVGVVGEIDAPVGSVWPEEAIASLKELVLTRGLTLEVVESVKVHEDIKLGRSSRDGYIDAYCRTIRNLGRAGIKVVCYDFMPVFDWMRTETARRLPDGSMTLAYREADAAASDPFANKFALPDWEAFLTPAELERAYDEYAVLGDPGLWDNLAYFLRAVIPVAEESGVRMALHPDDPCWPVCGLPRIITDEKAIDRMLTIVDSPANALTLCSGSLGCSAANDVPGLVRKYGAMNRIAFAHVRNVRWLDEPHSFEETAHYAGSGSLPMPEIMRAYRDSGFDGYIRPDHGRMIWGEQGSPGYGFYDRALGAMYLLGIWDGLGART